ncbi:MAG: hypothetical protein GY940_14385 [bacterium]|nr:hypothetical protein [bacterium]
MIKAIPVPVLPLSSIPEGETMNYSEIAASMGCPKAARAVAMVGAIRTTQCSPLPGACEKRQIENCCSESKTPIRIIEIYR